MSEWLKANWKYLLAAAAGFVIVVLLYLRTRVSSSAPATQVSFPANPSNAGAGADIAGAVQNAPAQVSYDVTSALGTIPVWLHTAASDESPLGAFLRPGQTLRAAGAPVTGGSFQGGDQWVPVNVGGTTYYAFLREVNLFSPGGVGGPGLVYQADVAGRLSTAALAAETGAHRAALSNSRLSRRLGHDARQALRESRRVFVESRGAAPARRAGGTRWAR